MSKMSNIKHIRYNIASHEAKILQLKRELPPFHTSVRYADINAVRDRKIAEIRYYSSEILKLKEQLQDLQEEILQDHLDSLVKPETEKPDFKEEQKLIKNISKMGKSIRKTIKEAAFELSSEMVRGDAVSVKEKARTLQGLIAWYKAIDTEKAIAAAAKKAEAKKTRLCDNLPGILEKEMDPENQFKSVKDGKIDFEHYYVREINAKHYLGYFVTETKDYQTKLYRFSTEAGMKSFFEAKMKEKTPEVWYGMYNIPDMLSRTTGKYEHLVRRFDKVEKIVNLMVTNDEPVFKARNHKVDWSKEAESQLSRGLGIKDGEYTDKIVLLDMSCVVNRIIITGHEDENVPLSADEVKSLTDRIQAIQERFISAAMSQGFKSSNSDEKTIYMALTSPGQTKKTHAWGSDKDTLEQNAPLFNEANVEFDKLKTNVSKLAQRLALVTTSSIPVSRIGLNLTVDDMIIVPDVNKMIKQLCVQIKMLGDKWLAKQIEEILVKFTNGAGWLICLEAKGLAIQARLFCGGKGFLIYFALVEYARKHNLSLKITDVYGVEHDIVNENIKVIVHASVIKAWADFKDENGKPSFEEYKKHCRDNAQYGFNEIHICAAAHKKPDAKAFGRQFMYTQRDLTDEEIKVIFKRQLRECKNLLTRKGALEYLTKQDNAIGQIAAVLPEFVNTSLAQAVIEEGFNKKVMAACNSRIGDDVTYKHITTDPTAVFDVLLNKDTWNTDKSDNEDVYVNDGAKIGILKAGYFASKDMDLIGGTYVALGRFPVNGDKAQIARIAKTKEVKEWLNTNAQYHSANDAIISLIDGDYDGDEVFRSTDPVIVENTKANTAKYLPVTYDLPSTVKVQIEGNLKKRNRQFAHAFVVGYHNSTIGADSNVVKKLFAACADPIYVAFGSAKAQAGVDSTKNGYTPTELNVCEADVPFYGVNGIVDVKSLVEDLQPYSERFNGIEFQNCYVVAKNTDIKRKYFELDANGRKILKHLNKATGELEYDLKKVQVSIFDEGYWTGCEEDKPSICVSDEGKRRQLVLRKEDADYLYYGDVNTEPKYDNPTSCTTDRIPVLFQEALKEMFGTAEYKPQYALHAAPVLLMKTNKDSSLRVAGTQCKKIRLVDHPELYEEIKKELHDSDNEYMAELEEIVQKSGEIGFVDFARIVLGGIAKFKVDLAEEISDDMEDQQSLTDKVSEKNAWARKFLRKYAVPSADKYKDIKFTDIQLDTMVYDVLFSSFWGSDKDKKFGSSSWGGAHNFQHVTCDMYVDIICRNIVDGLDIAALKKERGETEEVCADYEDYIPDMSEESAWYAVDDMEEDFDYEDAPF